MSDSDRHDLKRKWGISPVRKDGSLTSSETDEQATAAERFAAASLGAQFHSAVYATHGDADPNFRIADGRRVNAVWAGEVNGRPRIRGNLIINPDEPQRFADLYVVVIGMIDIGFGLEGWATHEELLVRAPRDFGYGPKLWIPFEDLHPFEPPAAATAPVRPYCPTCGSYFCPHAAPHLYRPPFSRSDELAAATKAWEAAHPVPWSE